MIWIPYRAQQYLKQLLNQNTTVFEYGCGDSTIFFAALCKHVVCVEHDVDWFEKIPSLPNILKIYQPVESNEIGRDKSNPYHYRSNCIGGNFKKYVDSLTEFAPDLVFIDGRSRCSCLQLTFDKQIKTIVIDNTERDWYTQNVPIPDNYEIVKFYGHGPRIEWAWETTFFIDKEKC
jgi:hypothetical protein